MSSETPINGSCFCGSVKYSAHCKPACWTQCHCSMCRKTVGSASTMFVAVNEQKLKFHAKETLKTFRSSADCKWSATRSFCSNCGCSLFMNYDNEKNTIWLLTGALDVVPPVVNPVQVYIENKATYFEEINSATSGQDPDYLSEFIWDSGKNV